MSTPGGEMLQPSRRTSPRSDSREPTDRDARAQRPLRSLADVVDQVVSTQLMPPSSISRRSTWEKRDRDSGPQTPMVRWRRAYENRHKVTGEPQTLIIQDSRNRDVHQHRDRPDRIFEERPLNPPPRVRQHSRPVILDRGPQTLRHRDPRLIRQDSGASAFDESRIYDEYRDGRRPTWRSSSPIRSRLYNRTYDADHGKKVLSHPEPAGHSNRTQLRRTGSTGSFVRKRNPDVLPPRRPEIIVNKQTPKSHGTSEGSDVGRDERIDIVTESEERSGPGSAQGQEPDHELGYHTGIGGTSLPPTQPDRSGTVESDVDSPAPREGGQAVDVGVGLESSELVFGEYSSSKGRPGLRTRVDRQASEIIIRRDSNKEPDDVDQGDISDVASDDLVEVYEESSEDEQLGRRRPYRVVDGDIREQSRRLKTHVTIPSDPSREQRSEVPVQRLQKRGDDDYHARRERLDGEISRLDYDISRLQNRLRTRREYTRVNDIDQDDLGWPVDYGYQDQEHGSLDDLVSPRLHHALTEDARIRRLSRKPGFYDRPAQTGQKHRHSGEPFTQQNSARGKELVRWIGRREESALRSPADPRFDLRAPELEDDIFQVTLQRRRPKSQLSADETTIVPGDPKRISSSRSNTLGKHPKYVQSYIYESRYITKTVPGRKMGEMISSTEAPRDGASSLYRWIHFNDANMWFNDFRKNMGKIEGLKQIEHDAITRLLDRVQHDVKKPIWSTKTGSGRSPKPPGGSVIEETFRDVSQTHGKSAGLQKVVWVCLPFFCVRPYAKTANTAIQTLLQSHYSTSTDRQRDIQQAVADLPDMRPKHGFHATEIWCLILNDSLLVTSAPAEKQDIFVKGAMSQIDASRPEPQRIRVSLGEALQYSFVRDQCQTWFDLSCQFAEFFPYQVKITFRGDVVDESSWPGILGRPEHKHRDIHLDLELGDLEDSPLRTALQDPDPDAKSGIQNQAAENAETSQDSTTSPEIASDKATGNNAGTPGPFDLASTAPAPIIPAVSGQREPDDQPSSQLDRRITPVEKPAATNQDTVHTAAVSKSWPTSEFNAFGWLAVENEDQTYMPETINLERLQQDLEEVDGQFGSLHEKHKSSEERSHPKDYATLNNKKVTVTHSKVWSYMNSHSVTSQNSTPDVSVDASLSRRVILFNLTEDLFKFFLPLDLEGPTTSKYWGAVFRLLLPRQFIKVMKSEGQIWASHEKEHAKTFDQTQLLMMQSFLQRLVRRTDPVRHLLTISRADWRPKLKIPNSLLSAWLYIIRALMQCANRSYAWRDNIPKAARLIDEVTKEIMDCLAKLVGETLVTKIVLRPAEVTSIISFNLLSGLNGGSRSINDTYTEYVRSLARKVDNDTMNRSHKDKFDRLQREVKAAIVVLDQQKLALKGLEVLLENASIRRVTRSAVGVDAYYPDDSLDAATISPSIEKLSPKDLGGYYRIFIRSCFEKIRTQMEDLCFVTEEVERLEAQTQRRMESDKSQREAAIYIFTIVTVIFLPLSTVASILGMNTNDIRNMDLDQWVFWVVAVPLVVFVIFLCLKLGDFWPNFTTLWSQGRLRFPFRIVWNKDTTSADDDDDDDTPPKRY